MTRLVVNQSNYIPWKGYFDLIHDADLFVFYDDVQFSYNGWRNRNRIKTPNGLHWLSIPVGSSHSRLICEVKLEDPKWASRHWKTIEQYYSKAPYFSLYRPFFEDCYLRHQWKSLSDLNQYLIKAIATEMLGIRCEFMDSRDFQLTGTRQDRLMELIDQIQPRSYISGPTGADYIDPEPFQQRNVELIFKKYDGYPEYSQFFPPFSHQVSILDTLFHLGPNSGAAIWGASQS